MGCRGRTPRGDAAKNETVGADREASGEGLGRSEGEGRGRWWPRRMEAARSREKECRAGRRAQEMPRTKRPVARAYIGNTIFMYLK